MTDRIIDTENGQPEFILDAMPGADEFDLWPDDVLLYLAKQGITETRAQGDGRDNLRRAFRAFRAVEDYPSGDTITSKLGDLLSDLHHLADLVGMDFESSIDRHYNDEIWEG
ncbi:hypothetical protein SEA_DATBOI_147 [Gordonia phage DatBoi]|nr:hypothetical protein SEA_DATBOI_147 [Gordonia phage DatBoi]